VATSIAALMRDGSVAREMPVLLPVQRKPLIAVARQRGSHIVNRKSFERGRPRTSWGALEYAVRRPRCRGSGAWRAY